jgi:uncharacterized protein (DUF1330 family)
MHQRIALGLAMLAGAAIGATAVNGLHAQAKPKAYSVTESEVLDQAAIASYLPAAQAAIKTAGGQVLYTAGGRVVAIIGEAPKRVAINQWDSLEQAQAFYSSKAWTDLAPQRDKAQSVKKLFIVEAVK